jgi:Uncharacterised nucleotidyltransferase
MAVTWDADPEISAEEVRRRFLWARRQGRPAWLWPDVSIEAWRAALEGIEGAIRALLAGEPCVSLEGEPQSIGLAGYTSGMGPLLGLWLEQGRLHASPAVAATLARHLAHNRLRTDSMTASAVEIVGRLSDRGLQTLVLKGAHTGWSYFPEAGARPASDIDLLVTAGEASEAEAVMEGCGLTFKGRSQWESGWAPTTASQVPRSLTYVHAEDPWSIDLHNSLNISAGWGTPLAGFDLAHPMASSGRWLVDPRAGVLDQPLLLLHLATHAGGGWQNLTLLRQVELVLVIRQDLAAGRLSWDAFLDLGAKTGAITYAYPALCLAEKLSPGAVPKEVLDICAAQAPRAVRRALQQLTPATAQRIDRNSLTEHFMWAASWRGRVRLLVRDLFPADRSWPEFRRIYEERAWRLIRGRVSQ